MLLLDTRWNTYGVLGLNEGVVDGDDVDVLVLDAVSCQFPIFLLL